MLVTYCTPAGSETKREIALDTGYDMDILKDYIIHEWYQFMKHCTLEKGDKLEEFSAYQYGMRNVVRACMAADPPNWDPLSAVSPKAIVDIGGGFGQMLDSMNFGGSVREFVIEKYDIDRIGTSMADLTKNTRRTYITTLNYGQLLSSIEYLKDLEQPVCWLLANFLHNRNDVEIRKLMGQIHRKGGYVCVVETNPKSALGYLLKPALMQRNSHPINLDIDSLMWPFKGFKCLRKWDANRYYKAALYVPYKRANQATSR